MQTANPRRWAALGLIALAQFMVIMDTSIIGVALPEIRTDLSFAAGDLSWVFNAYVIAFGGLLLLGGRLSDLLGARRVFAAGWAILAGASLAAGLAETTGVEIAARAAQGAGAALIAPSALTLLMMLFGSEPKELMKAFAIYGAAAPAGGTAGVFLGGVITEWISWPWVFYVNIPIAIGVLAAIPALLPAAPARRGSIDVGGALAATAGLALTVFGVVRAPEEGWGSLATLGAIAGGLALLAAFVAIQAARREPLMRLGILRTPNLAAANLAQVLLGAAWIPMWFFLNLYLQQVLGYGAFEGGAALLPMTAAIMLLMIVVAPRVVNRLRFKTPIVIGLLLLATGMALLSLVRPDGSFVVDVLPASLIAAAGMALAFIPSLGTAISSARPEEGGLASGIVNTSYQVGSALGLAAMTALASAQGADRIGDITSLTDGYSAAFLGAAAIAVAGAALAAGLLAAPTPGLAGAGRALAGSPPPLKEHGLMTSRNLAASVGRWSAQHRKTAILGWIVFVVLATLIGGRVGVNEIGESAAGSGESKRGDMLVEAADFPEQSGEQVLIQGKGSVKSGDREVVAAVEDVVARLAAIPGVTGIESPLDASHRANTVSADGRSVAVNFTMRGTDEQVEKLVDEPLAAVAATQAAHSGVRIEQFGEVSATKEIAAQDAKDGTRSETISYGLMLIILLVAFGALVAAGIPLVLGATAVIATVGLLGPVSQVYALAPDVAQLVVIIGLAVGVDYAMFYSRRMMEERDKGRSAEAALEIAAATSGRAVLISGLTVMTAMAGLLFAGNPIFAAFGIGTMLVVAVTVLGSLTFLPATLSFLGEKGWLEKGRVPYVTARRHRAKGESRVWSAILDRVLKRPLVSAILAGGLLVALSVPALGLQFKDPGLDGYSRSQPVIQTYDRVQAAFPGGAVPALTVIKAQDVTAAPVQSAIRELHDRALASGQLSDPSSVEISPDKTVAVVALAVKGSGTDAASERSLEVLRSQVVPATVGKLQGADVAVSGMTAGSKDFIDETTSRLPIVFGFVFGLAFILLLVTFRSIVIPIKAIVLNLLSVGSAYGVLVLVFQDGLGEGLLNFESVGGIAPWIPLFLFVILFGLSMDYHVLVLSRVREAVDRGMGNDEAVAHGIKSTAGVVTSAALVMVAVFGAFALGSDQVVKQIGVGLAAAILIDATIIRAVLLPATMKLLGARNWYLPKRLGWLPRFAHEPEVAAAAA